MLALAARLGLKDRGQRKTHLVGTRWRRRLLSDVQGRTALRLLEAGSLGVGCFEEGQEEG